jgi:2-isopropylmalate synthase
MTPAATARAARPAAGAMTEQAFSVERWSATSGNGRPSRANLTLRGAGRRWSAHSEGNGAVDALLKSVDLALAPVLGEGVELQTYNVHATGEGHDTEAAVTLSVRSRSEQDHAPAYPGRAVRPNILEASLMAYVDAINRLLVHGGVDVANAAPLRTTTPERRIADGTSHAETLTDLYNR